MKKYLSILLLILSLISWGQNINSISIEIFQNGSSVDLQTFNAFTPSASIDEVVVLNTSALSPGMYSFSVTLSNDGNVSSILASGTFLQEEVIVENATITDVEYFIDNDPGAGAGTSITISPSSSISLTETLSTSGLSEGFHTLYLRAKDETGRWGIYSSTTFYIESSIGVGDVVQIEALEYFVDTDPGAGSGTPISASPNSEIALVENLNFSGLTQGFHNVYLRGKLTNGAWGPYSVTTVYVESSIGVNDAVVVDDLEYFIDSDPGAGLGTSLTISPNSEVSLTDNIDLSGLSTGFHTLYLRGKLTSGAWGVYTTQSIYIEVSDQQTQEQITEMEYFFDADPGVGNGMAVSSSLPATDVNETISLAAGSLSSGTHTVAFRAKEESGLWGHYQTQQIEVLAGELVESIADGDWNDPSIWSGGAVPSNIDSTVVQNAVSLNVATDTVLALTIADGGDLNLSSNDIHVIGRFTAQTGGVFQAVGGSLFMDGGSQTYSHGGNIVHGSLIFGGSGTKTLNYLEADNLAVNDSIHIESGVSLAFTSSPNLSLISDADFVNDGSISTSNKWSLFLNGDSHTIDGGDFENVTLQQATIVDLTSDFNFDGEFNSGGFGSTVNLGIRKIDLGSSWIFNTPDILSFTSGGRLEANKAVNFEMDVDVPLTFVSIPSGSFDAAGDLTFGANQLLSIEQGIVNLNSVTFNGSGGFSLTGGELNIDSSEILLGDGSTIVNDGGNISIIGNSIITGISTSDTYTFINNSGSVTLDGTQISEVGGLGLALIGGSVSLTNLTFTNGLGVSYITFGSDVFDGNTFEGIFFEPGPTFNVSINDGVVATVTFDQYGGAFGGPDNDNVGTGTINWTNPQGAGTVTVVTPNGGEELNAGTVFDISWTTENVTETDLIEISLSENGGTDYSMLADGTFETFNGIFSWTVSGSQGTENLIRVTNLTQGISDESDNFFTIAPGSGAPEVMPPTDSTSTSFVANWANTGANSYFLDVSIEEDFATFVAGFEDLETSESFANVTGLDFKQSYFYRVRADYGSGVSDNSETQSARTIIDTETIADSTALVQIYDALGGSSWNPAVNWETARLRDWDNILLNTDRTRIEEVDISVLEAAGDMPNPFTGEAVGGLTSLLVLDASDNQISGLMDFSGGTITNLDVSGNNLHFDDLEPVTGIETIDYSNQASVFFNESQAEAIKVRYDTDFNLSFEIGGSANEYAWFQDGEAIVTSSAFAVNGDNLDILNIDYDNMGEFNVEVTSTLVSGLIIEVEPQEVLAIADFVVTVLGADGQAIPESVSGYLLETTQKARGFDTLEQVLNVESVFTFPDVVLGNYLAAVDSDPEKYISTYSGDEFLWDRADTIFFRNDDGVEIRIEAIPPETEGDGKVSGTIEEDFEEGGGRIDARRRAAKRKCGLRRKTGSGRTEADDDDFKLIAYGETNDNGEFEYGELPTGTYRFFVEYPGIPLDESSFVEFEVGEEGISENEFKLAATVSENGIVVELIEELGVINKYFKDLLIYPNPSSDLLNISYRHLTTSEVSVQLVDITGAVLYQEDLRKGYDRDLSLNVKDYPEGIYLLRFYDKASREKNMMSYRIMVQRQ